MRQLLHAACWSRPPPPCLPPYPPSPNTHTSICLPERRGASSRITLGTSARLIIAVRDEVCKGHRTVLHRVAVDFQSVKVS